jgi:ABC-type uncharacterized transport system substrate-binding protein
VSRERVSRLLAILLLLGVAAIIFRANYVKPRVLIVHSYNTDYSWVVGVDAGMQRVVSKWNNYSIMRHYMDTKKYNDKDWLNKVGLIARDAIDKAQPDVLIAMDDEAQDLAVKYYVDHPNIKIVFGGINGSIKPYGYDKAQNVTGILELRQLDGLREAIEQLDAGKKSPKPTGKNSAEGKKPIRIFYMLDASKPVLGDRGYIDTYDWKPLEYVGSHSAVDFPSWKKAVLECAGKTDYIFVTNYRQLARSPSEKKFVPASEVMKWTEENSPVPVIGLQVFNVDDGGMLAIGTSPYEQGEEMAKMAEDILEQRVRADQIAIKKNTHFIVAMRKSLLDKRGLTVPSVYESFSRATNTFYD